MLGNLITLVPSSLPYQVRQDDQAGVVRGQILRKIGNNTPRKRDIHRANSDVRSISKFPDYGQKRCTCQFRRLINFGVNYICF